MSRGRPSRETVYRRLDAAIDELARLGGLPAPKQSDAIWADIWHLETHHSTALEGNTLVLREVAQLLDEGRAVGAKPLKEYMEVRGYAEAASWVYGQALEPDGWSDGELVSRNEVRRVHMMAMTPVWGVEPHPEATDREGPGNFREHDIHPFGGGMVPPAWADVPADIDEWVQQVVAFGRQVRTGSAPRAPLPEEIARLHNHFERIHPFLDGNGRTGRLLMNLVLVRLGHPPVIIFKRQRDSYLSALQKSDAGDHGPLGEVIARAMIENLNRFIVPAVAGDEQLVTLSALANEEFTAAALLQAAQRQRLWAVKGSAETWRSTRQAVHEYAMTKHRRRPKAD